MAKKSNAYLEIDRCYREVTEEMIGLGEVSKFSSKSLVESLSEPGKMEISIDAPSKNWFKMMAEYEAPDMYTGYGGISSFKGSCRVDGKEKLISCDEDECIISKF